MWLTYRQLFTLQPNYEIRMLHAPTTGLSFGEPSGAADNTISRHERRMAAVFPKTLLSECQLS